MKYTTLDTNGLPTAFYSDDVHSDIPKEAIEITDEQWLECINNQGQRRLVDSELVEYVYMPTEAELLALQVAEAKQYLADTAWYIERLNDPSSGKAVPKEVLHRRAEAREGAQL